MSAPGIPTFDQLSVFLTVVEMGSFAGAARQLGRATSVISYSIANLERQLGVCLFVRNATRRPQLTDDGRTLLAEARNVTLGIHRLRARALGLRQGLESEVRLALDAMLPAHGSCQRSKLFARSSRPSLCDFGRSPSAR